MTKNKRIIIIVLVVFGLLTVSGLVLLLAGKNLVVTHYTVESADLPPSFDGYKIAQISDLHNHEYGEGQQELLHYIIEFDPDMIVLTGDIVNRDDFDFEMVLQLVEDLAEIAPVYTVDGNHEFENTADRELLNAIYAQHGVVMDNNALVIPSPDQSSNEEIILFGQKVENNDEGHHWIDFSAHENEDELYSILLTHFSNHFDSISPSHYDLVLAGHTHGGIIRLPFVGGLFSTEGDLFPEYDGGMFVENGTTMISSRGLGQSGPDIRMNNPPELVTVTLRHSDT